MVRTAHQSFVCCSCAHSPSPSCCCWQDLKLLAHDEDSEEEEAEGVSGAVSGGESTGNLAGLGAQPGASYASLERLGSGEGGHMGRQGCRTGDGPVGGGRGV